MKRLFANTRGLVGLVLRRERLIIPLWVLGLVGSFVGLLPLFEEIMATTPDMTAIEETMKSPAMVAMVGPYYPVEGYSLGSLYASYMLLYAAVLVALMNIFFVVRHTRADEEAGHLDLLQALPIGRLANLASLVLISLGFNLLIGLGTGLGIYLISPGLAFWPCLHFGGLLFGTGVFYTALSLFLAQIFISKRGLMAASFLLLFGAYIQRAIGDLYWEGLSLFSPLGLILRSQNFVKDYTWPLLCIILMGLVFLILAALIASRRDLGGGLIAERKGAKHASPLLRGPLSLAFRLSWGSIFLWALVVFGLASMYGSVFGDLESYIQSSQLMKDMFEMGQGQNLLEEFVAILMTVMAIISTVPVLIQVHKVLGQEKKSLSQEVLAQAVSRREYLASYFIPALIMAVVFPLIAGLGFWGVGHYFLEEIPSLETFLIGGAQYIPALLFFLSVSTLLIGLMPRLAWLSYVYLALCFFESYLGRLIDLPQLVHDLSPYYHVVKYPVEGLKWEPSLGLMGLFLVFTLMGFHSYSRRDLM